MKFPDILKSLRKREGLNQLELANSIGVSRSAISMYESGQREPDFETMETIADYFNVSMDYLHGKSDKMGGSSKLPQPTISENTTTYPVIGDVAAGYDHIAYEDWAGDTIEIPDSYLCGHDKSDFFVLRVIGNSMYPLYRDGDKILVLKQSTLNYSGEIGVVLYNDDCGTLKKVEYKEGEDWLRLVPINPNYEPVRIEGEELEHCRVLGIPKLLIRELD